MYIILLVAKKHNAYKYSKLFLDEGLKIKDILTKSLVALKNNKELVIFSSLIDAVFFIALGFLTSPFFLRIVTELNFIGTTIQQTAPELTRTFTDNSGLFNLLFTDPVLSSHTKTLLIMYLTVAVIIYVLYIGAQGLNWNIARTIAGKKEELGHYIKSFALVNVTWLIVFGIIHFLDVIASLQATATAGTVVTNPVNALGIFAKIILVLAAYFALVSYNEKSVKISIGISKWKQYVPTFLIVGVVFFTINELLKVTPKLGDATNILIGIIILLPALAWARIYYSLQ